MPAAPRFEGVNVISEQLHVIKNKEEQLFQISFVQKQTCEPFELKCFLYSVCMMLK